MQDLTLQAGTEEHRPVEELRHSRIAVEEVMTEGNQCSSMAVAHYRHRKQDDHHTHAVEVATLKPQVTTRSLGAL
jgi:hypothetical protein